MRDEKLKLIQEYIDELKTIRYEINKKTNNRFLSSIPYLYTLNNGMTIPREKILKNGTDGSAVIIAPFISETKEFLVVIEPRVFTKLGVGVSFPAGYIEKGEKPVDAALRELREETGYTATKIIEIDSYYQDEGISSAYNHLFLTLDTKKEFEQSLDENEIIKYETLTYPELLELENMGIISGGNTKLTLAKIKKYIN